jgi:hypothetical protein
MSYFADCRKANQEANRAAIATHKTLSPYADYEGGKYEPMQYEGRECELGRPKLLTLAELEYNEKHIVERYRKYRAVLAAKIAQARKELDESAAAIDAKMTQFMAMGISVSIEDTSDSFDSWDYPD